MGDNSLGKETSHNSHSRAKDHPPRDKGKSRLTSLQDDEICGNSSTAQSSYKTFSRSPTGIIDKNLISDSEKHEGKGKRKASEMGIESGTRSARSAVSEATGSITDTGTSELNLTPPVEDSLRTDAEMSGGEQASSGPSGSKLRKPPRHKTLFETVQAHLSGNGGAKGVSKEFKKEQNFQGSLF